MLNFMKTFVTRLQTQQLLSSSNVPKRLNLQSPCGIRCLHDENEEAETEKLIKELCKGDKELEKKCNVIILEVDVMRQDGRRAPQRMQPRHWEHILQLDSRSQRINYLAYLWKREMSQLNDKARKAAKRHEFETRPKEPPVKEFPDDLLYGLGHQSMFLRISDRAINAYDNYRALEAMQFGQPIVVDCSYETKMVMKERQNAAKQVTFLYGSNRLHKDPFDLHLCNLNQTGEFMKQLTRNIPTITEPWFPMTMHEGSYLDVFPKKDLVYLTPHCREELTEYDHDAVYIVGCMVDKVNNEPLSLAKAKRDGIKMAKLPLDRHLDWGLGSKTLNINHIVDILLDLKSTNDWEYALRHVPRRKLLQYQQTGIRNMTNTHYTREVLNMRNKFEYRQKKQWKRNSYNMHKLFDDSYKI